MIAYHATKRKDHLEAILATSTLLPGRNMGTGELFVHIAVRPFVPSLYPLSVIAYTGNLEEEAWIIEFEIPDNTPLRPDPAEDCIDYTGYPDSWMIHDGPLAIEVKKVTHIPNVFAWEEGLTQEEFKEKYGSGEKP